MYVSRPYSTVLFCHKQNIEIRLRKENVGLQLEKIQSYQDCSSTEYRCNQYRIDFSVGIRCLGDPDVEKVKPKAMISVSSNHTEVIFGK